MNPQLRDKIERISNLPTLPQVASRLLEMVNDTETNAADVASLVSQDVSLSAKILRLANSAFYGTPRSISTIQTAVVRLGFKVINTLVLSLTVFDMFPVSRRAVRFDRKAFWHHCVRCGLLAKILAQRGGGRAAEPEEAFCAGLLHDIGKVVMEQYLHEDFTAALEYARQQQKAYCTAEVETLGYSHTDVAAWLISRWDLPDTLSVPITHHHAPLDADPFEGMAGICHCADFLCYGTEIADPDAGVPPPLSEASLAPARLSPDDLEPVRERFAQELEKMSPFFELVG
ncbi:MAG: HDOD domain-containing protein [Chitinivibrionales bacterium]|nr:HDOD domain-containing protein [Chitinivibrionales bacterium]MBD3394128.1 HDOD domain-containing protein [Chitinivibrionales bacterium]